TGALAVVCVSSIAHSAGVTLPVLVSVVASITIVFLLSIINIVGVLWGGWTQAITTIIKCGMVCVIALAPVFFEFFGKDVIDASRFLQSTTPEKTGLAAQAAAVLLAVMWAFNGWEGVVPVAEEVKNPDRNIPLALIGGIGLLGLLYVGANTAYHAVVPIEVMIQPENREHVAEILVAQLFGPLGGTLMSLGIVLSTLGTINSNLLTSPRVTYAMGRDGLLHEGFGKLHERFRTPVFAILAQAVMAALLVIASAVAIQTSSRFQGTTIFDLLTECIVFAASVFYALAVAAVLVLRRTQPEAVRPFRTPGYPWVPILYLIVYAWFIASIFLGKPYEAIIGLFLIALGLPIYFYQRLRKPTEPSLENRMS
ncbi:MAG: APC family permease, partial [Planctomycetes bacterium]|nr:APC family permease [Planctomycetota bacterium]